MLKNLNCNNVRSIKKLKNAKDRIKGSELMIKKIAWNTFKNTGNVDTFLEYKQIQDIEQQLSNINKETIQKNNLYGDIQE